MLSDDELKKALTRYQEVIEAQAVSRKQPLVELDAWYRGELRKSLQARKDKDLTRDEVMRIMTWKLARGKFRPRLQQLVAENSDKEVQEATSASHRFLVAGEPVKSLKALTVLKAVGPATASAILALQEPETYAFLSDEAIAAVGAERKYTQKAWESFQELIEERRKAWAGGAEEFERACYAAVAGKRLSILDEPEEAPPHKKKRTMR